ncbi:MAG: ATP-binding protein [Clostridiales bacterium]|nr:ATP-binding protein [Clostridiales bacterium]
MKLHYEVAGDDLVWAGAAASDLKNELKRLGICPEVIRKTAVAMYEAEINMVIHADGGSIDVDISPDSILVTLKDNGVGIPDIEKAMIEGYSTASEEVRDMGFGAGMGLPNIKRCADVLKITSEIGVGTTVEIQVNI